MRLHYAPGSAHSAAVRVALAEKRVEVELHKLDLDQFEQHSREYLAINRDGMVPVIEDRGHKLSETVFILEYLDETGLDPPLAGGDPRQRYAARKWGKYVETHIAPHLAIARWAALGGKVPAAAARGFANLPPARRELWRQAQRGFEPERIAAARQALRTAGERLAADLAGNEWLAGDRFTLADIAVYPHAAQFASLDLPLPGPAGEWLARVARRPSVRAVADDLFPLAVMGPEPGRWG